MTLLTIENLGKRYGDVSALENIHLQIAEGSRAAIVGPSGSGKTTLLRIVAGFEAPDVGRVRLGDSTIADGPSIVPAHLRNIGIVAQDGALFPHLDIAENIGFGLPRSTPRRSELIRELLELVEFDSAMLDRRPHQLSGGQQQRVALARALARKPKLMLLDEPFSALDTGLRENMRRAVTRVLETAGITTILVTHDQAEALSFADQVAVLRDGRLIQAGSPRDLYFAPADKQTALFLGDAIVLDAMLQDGLAHCILGDVEADGTESGRREIMIRPEQLSFVKPEGNAEILADITAIEFGGASCLVTLRLLGRPAFDSITVRTTALNLPPLGSTVGIDVIGKCHVLG